ncbi:Uu.00g092390.m01.CDS01 [Anthostomella pinea]|uniref:Uu.00g092390.m01.CDS01 n=1 Tax=Anthostomella pinea TaxID=933095 RepID=A0AAI8VNC4_9PEZI|nr:Uu.00g092390.m01.CDS01 [Anthostomella pinea]
MKPDLTKLPPQVAVHFNSNWVFMYVVLVLIPVVFVGVALFSRKRDHVVIRKHDVEKGVAAGSAGAGAAVARPRPAMVPPVMSLPYGAAQPRDESRASYEPGSEKSRAPIYEVKSRESSTSTTAAQVGQAEQSPSGDGLSRGKEEANVYIHSQGSSRYSSQESFHNVPF